MSWGSTPPSVPECVLRLMSSKERNRITNPEGGETLLTNQINMQEDLFETIETLPYKVQLILSEFSEEDNTYENCANLLSRCEAEGYTFEYGLDAIPYNLTKIKSNGESTLL